MANFVWGGQEKTSRGDITQIPEGKNERSMKRAQERALQAEETASVKTPIWEGATVPVC